MGFKKKYYFIGIIISLMWLMTSSMVANQLVFQDGLNGYSGTEDTSIYSTTPNGNFGTSDYLAALGLPNWEDTRQSFIRFTDIVGESFNQIPKDSYVTSAQLEIFVSDKRWYKEGENKVAIYKMLTPWAEGTQKWGASELGSSCFSYRYYDTTYWGDNTMKVRGPVNGIDFESSSAVTFFWDNQEGAKATWDVTSFVNDWIANPDSNYGVWIHSLSGWYGCNFYSSDYTDHAMRPRLVIEYEPRVAAPKIIPTGGIYGDSVTVEINTDTEGSTIYYTTDGSAPTEESQLYTGPFTLTESATVKAVAYHDAWWPSHITEESYTVLPKLPSPTLETEGGEYFNHVEVAIESVEEAEIYYTLDGSEPTKLSLKYRSPLELTQTTTLKVIAFGNGYVESDVVSANYEIKYKLDPSKESRIKYCSNLGSITLYITEGSISQEVILKIEVLENIEDSTGLAFRVSETELINPGMVVMDYSLVLDNIFNEANLAVCIWNGEIWVPLGGIVDKRNQTIKTNIAMLGDFKLMEYSQEEARTLLSKVAFSSNPFQIETELNTVLRFYLNKPAEVTFQIWNTRGNKQLHKVSGHFQKGLNSFIWDGSSNGSQLAPGLYVFKVSAKAIDNEKAQFIGLISIKGGAK